NTTPGLFLRRENYDRELTGVDVIQELMGVRSGSKLHSFGKRQLSVKRNPNVPVEVRGWLHKQDSSGMRLWKRKWFVLSDFCLFYYKDSREQSVLGSIPLPSYEVCPVGAHDHISRKYAFKVKVLQILRILLLSFLSTV
uniref:PH domain-containing protein n=1 Tax=Periophthalmus magnuspinnatus TaxID=409849 RepID=A0A3B4BB37_9GOBI